MTPGLIFKAVVFFGDPNQVFPDSPESRAGWVLLVLGFYWGLELIPLAATALLPVVFFPVLGILSVSTI